MSKILAYLPTYSQTEAEILNPRPYRRLSNEEITRRLQTKEGRIKPGVYFDSIDSIMNTRPDIDLVVVDGKSTDSIRECLKMHHGENKNYTMLFYPEKMSQWELLNDVYKKYTTPNTKYFVYTSSDVIWQKYKLNGVETNWVDEAIKEFERNPKLQMLFPCVSTGDGNIPIQVSPGPRDLDPMVAPYDQYGKAPVLNAYAVIFRIEFLNKYGGYPNLYRNCYTESFLHYLCEAMGGQMRLLPRGWVFHWGTVDIWQENGSFYYYNEEKDLFHNIMSKVQMMDAAGMMTPEFLKKILWKPEVQPAQLTVA